MNYYERHIGDYLKDTAHLSLLEHGVYGRMLDVYYTRESGIEAGDYCRLIGARSQGEKAAVQSVLVEFFELVGTVWTHKRCDREIDRYRRKAERNREVGKLGGRPRKSETHEKPIGLLVGYEPEPTPNPPSSQKPVTIPFSDKLKEGSGSAPSTAPPTPPPDFDGKNAEALNGKAVVSIAAGFELPDAWGFDAEALGFRPPEVLREGEKFRQYWTAGKGSGTRRSVKGWRQTWSNWLEKAAKDAR